MADPLPSATETFGKLKKLITKIVPFITFSIGFIIGVPLLTPVAGFFNQITGGLAKGKGGLTQDILQFAQWLPAGLLLGGGLMLAAQLTRELLGDMVANAIIGFGAGLLAVSIYMPFHDKIKLPIVTL